MVRTVVGCKTMWTNHGKCNDLRAQIKAYRNQIRRDWQAKGYFDAVVDRTPATSVDAEQLQKRRTKLLNQELDQLVGGISYADFVFLQKGKQDRSKLLNLCFLSFGAPKILPYMLMFNPDLLPSPLQLPPDVEPEPTQPQTSSAAAAPMVRSTNTNHKVESMGEKLARQRSTLIVETLLQLEKDAREIPALAKLNIFGRKQQEQRRQSIQSLNQGIADWLMVGQKSTPTTDSGPARLLQEYVRPFLVRTTHDFTRLEQRLGTLPKPVVRGLSQLVVPGGGGGGFLSQFTPHFLVRGQLVTHLQNLEQADRFVLQNYDSVVHELFPQTYGQERRRVLLEEEQQQQDEASGTTSSPRATPTTTTTTTIPPPCSWQVLQEACRDRLIGSPACSTRVELEHALHEWIQVMATAATPPSTGQEGGPFTTSSSNSPIPQTLQQSSSEQPPYYYNANVARMALLSYYGLQGTSDARNPAAQLPRLLFTSALSLSESNDKKNGNQQPKTSKSKSRFRR